MTRAVAIIFDITPVL